MHHCTGPDGIVRSGQILANLTNCYIDSGSVTTITFNNYYVNGNKITGTEIITNEGRNSLGQPVFGVQVQNGNLYSSNGVTTYNSVQQRTWIQGYNTLLNPMDDVYLITGTANGVNASGTTYSIVTYFSIKGCIGLCMDGKRNNNASRNLVLL